MGVKPSLLTATRPLPLCDSVAQDKSLFFFINVCISMCMHTSYHAHTWPTGRIAQAKPVISMTTISLANSTIRISLWKHDHSVDTATDISVWSFLLYHPFQWLLLLPCV